MQILRYGEFYRAMDIFTDGVMLVLASITFLVMFGLMLVLIRWHDFDALWCVAFLVSQGFLTVWYYNAWLHASDLLSTFPLLGASARPGIIGIWITVLLYAGNKVYHKWKVRV